MEHVDNTDRFLEFFVAGAQKLGFSFQGDIIEKFQLFYKELSEWNRSVNLTGLQTDQDQAVLLFVDSLAGSLAFSKDSSLSIIDIGTGGGFPGIPLKIAFPSLQATLMEPRGNKTAFLHTVIGKLELKGISVLQKRLEACRAFKDEESKWDMAISKAVSVEVILPYVKDILKENGKLVVFRSTTIEHTQDLKGMVIEKEMPYELPYGFGARVISVLKHVP